MSWLSSVGKLFRIGLARRNFFERARPVRLCQPHVERLEERQLLSGCTGWPSNFHTSEGTLLEVSSPGALIHYRSDGVQRVVTTWRQSTDHGSVDLAADGSFSYVPDAGFRGV